MKKKRTLSLDDRILLPLVNASEDSGLSLSLLVECAIQYARARGYLRPLPELDSEVKTRVSVVTHKGLAQVAQFKKESLSVVVREALNQYLERHGEKGVPA